MELHSIPKIKPELISAQALSPRLFYEIVLTAQTPIAVGAYEWSFATTSAYNPTDYWLAGGPVLTSGNGSSPSWKVSGATCAQFAINATEIPVPEPSALGLLALGGFLFLWHRRNAKAVGATKVPYMKRAILLAILALALAVLSPQVAQAQGTLYVSSLDLTSSGSASVGSDSWLATDIRTGTNASGYLLNSVQLALTDASGTPSGFTAMIYNINPLIEVPVPGSSLGTLNGSLDPVAGGVYTYSPASSLTLSPSTVYYIVLTAGTAVANGAYEWSFANTFAPTISGGWIGGRILLSSSVGLNWEPVPSALPQFAIYATPAVPEPSILGLLALGGFFLVRHRRKAKAIYEKNNH
jgi:hypothetical protein